MAAAVHNMTTYDAARLRLEKSLRGMRGLLLCVSTTMKTVYNSAAAARHATVVASAQPSLGARTKPYTNAVVAAVTVTAPGTSRRPRRAVDLGSTRGATTATTTPMGTLMKNTHRQEATSVSTPPTSKPIALPAPDIAAYTPIARVRAGPSANVSPMSDKAVGAAIAAPHPWTARAATSHAEVVARPPASDAAAKRSRPKTNMRRRPR